MIATSKVFTGLEILLKVDTTKGFCSASPWWGVVLVVSCYESKLQMIRLPVEFLVYPDTAKVRTLRVERV